LKKNRLKGYFINTKPNPGHLKDPSYVPLMKLSIVITPSVNVNDADVSLYAKIIQYALIPIPI